MSNLSELLPSGGGQNNVEFVAQGTLTNGQAVRLRTDGKVEAISVQPAGISSNINVDADQPRYNQCIYVSNVNRVAIIFQNNTTGYPEAVIGEVSGSSITFGTPVQITTVVSYMPMRATYDASADRLVAFFGDGGSAGYRGFVGTINAATNSSSWGSEQQRSLGILCKARACIYMPDALHTLFIFWQNSGNGYLRAASAKVNSNNTITWVSQTNIQTSNGPGYNDYGCDVTYDSNQQVAIAGYNFGYSTSVAAITIGMDTSGNIAIGTQRSLYSAGYFDCVAIDYDSKTQKCGLVADAAGNGYMIGVYADSSTTLAQGSSGPYSLGGLFGGEPEGSIKSNGNNQFIYAYTYNSSGVIKPAYWLMYIDSNNDLYNSSSSIDIASASSNGDFDIAYDTTTQKFIINFYYNGTSDKNQAYLYNYPISNNGDVIGITSQAISSGASGNVSLLGGINESQSGMTPGDTMYVQGDGSITNSSSGTYTPVLIGTAVSATTLNIKDL
tara:strand:+ start:236 stop:1732 length:1497 start_codon:yes stop_codon:yes gene_type:complete